MNKKLLSALMFCVYSSSSANSLRYAAIVINDDLRSVIEKVVNKEKNKKQLNTTKQEDTNSRNELLSEKEIEQLKVFLAFLKLLEEDNKHMVILDSQELKSSVLNSILEGCMSSFIMACCAKIFVDYFWK